MKRTIENDIVPAKSFEHGITIAKKVIDDREFFKFIDELEADHDKVSGIGFYGNREMFLKAFREKRLYSLHMRENDSMFRRGAQCDPLFITNTFYVLPCLCIVTKERRDTVDILWIAKRARNQGFGTAMLEDLGIRYVTEIVNNTEEFWENRGIVNVHGMKMPFKSIISGNSFLSHTERVEEEEESSLESLCDSSEEEDEVHSESLTDIIVYKIWILSDLFAIKDIGHIVMSLLRQVYCHMVEFAEIDPQFWSSVHGIMSSRRLEIQRYKSTSLLSSRVCDHPLWFGQFVHDVDNITRNKTMMIVRPYYCGDAQLSLFKSSVFLYGNLRVHTERIRYRNNENAWLIVIVDTGINMEKAIAFARLVDREND